ncbi:MAG: GH1 family beta-glucosidase [Candidatus Eisenbacteria bacterium]
MSASIRFPDRFLWGAATSAYQIEGSPLADGAGESNWHRFTHEQRGDTGDVACDHYRRFEEDVAIMNEIGLAAYRFSIAWSRIQPDGRGRPNRRGIDFYSRLVDALLESGIRPCVTLYHWDHPAALDERGGWLSPDMPRRFADYASIVYDALGDRAAMWMTLNEPWVVAHAGFMGGVHPPGHRSAAETAVASRHMLLAHSLAVRAGRAGGRSPIGLVVNIEPKDAASDDREDIAARERADIYMNRQYLAPLYREGPPKGLAGIYGDRWPGFTDDDLALIAEPVDFLGINYYTRAVVRHDERVLPDRAKPVRQEGAEYTETGWEVFPEGLTRTLLRIKEQCGEIPLYITENGAAFPDPASVRGDTLSDPLRVDYFRAHLRAVHEAIDAGVDVRGYFAWSLMDNLEWSQGFSKRFGLVHVDFETGKRTMKESARFYQEVIKTNGEALG